MARAGRVRQNACMSRRSFDLTPELMLRAYRVGLFPMAETRESKRLYWLDPDMRGILPLDGFHLPRRLLRTVLSGSFMVTVDQDFPAVIGQCAAISPVRDDSWINPQIERLFTQLYDMGHAHSVECRQNGMLVGGLYGVKLGGAFFGESMFSRARDASKVALVHLVARLRMGGFTLLDTQFVTDHLTQFGAREIPREAYRQRLADALAIPARWLAECDPALLATEIRSITGRA
jgi:leucyl/phenylalanyl-tRNA---protein transferase